MAYVKGFCGQTNGQAKNYMPPVFRWGGGCVCGGVVVLFGENMVFVAVR